jgi:hypothetical protein
MTVTPEFKDFFNAHFQSHWKNKDLTLQGQLSEKDISDMITRIEQLVLSFNSDERILDKYLQETLSNPKLFKETDTEVLCVLYMVLMGNCGFENITESKSLREVLIKYREYLRAIKEFNKPSRVDALHRFVNG